jgi:hypothetical protein
MNAPSVIDRRDFLAKSLPAGVGLCLGCWLALAKTSAQEPAQAAAAAPTPPADAFRAGVAARSGMSHEEVFNFAFRDHAIPLFLTLADTIGREKLVELLKTATDGIWSDKGYRRHFFGNIKSADLFAHVVVMTDATKSPGGHAMKVTRCLWAETYRAAGAADIGYATWCHADHPIALANKEKLERPTCLMLGHDCCAFTWTKLT